MRQLRRERRSRTASAISRMTGGSHTSGAVQKNIASPCHSGRTSQQHQRDERQRDRNGPRLGIHRPRPWSWLRATALASSFLLIFERPSRPPASRARRAPLWCCRTRRRRRRSASAGRARRRRAARPARPTGPSRPSLPSGADLLERVLDGRPRGAVGALLAVVLLFGGVERRVRALSLLRRALRACRADLPSVGMVSVLSAPPAGPTDREAGRPPDRPASRPPSRSGNGANPSRGPTLRLDGLGD